MLHPLHQPPQGLKLIAHSHLRMARSSTDGTMDTPEHDGKQESAEFDNRDSANAKPDGGQVT